MTKQRDLLRQVKLSRPSGEGSYEDICWIDNRLAVMNRRVMREDTQEVWTVAELYGTRSFEDVDKLYTVWKRFAELLEK